MGNTDEGEEDKRSGGGRPLWLRVETSECTTYKGGRTVVRGELCEQSGDALEQKRMYA